MANDLNRVMIVGRLVKDPELRRLNTGISVVGFSIANNRSYVKDGKKSEQVSYIECVAWGKLAETIAQYCKKGNLLGVDGRLQQRSWDDKEGKKRYTVEVVVENIQFLSSNKSDTKNNTSHNQNNFDEDIPF